MSPENTLRLKLADEEYTNDYRMVVGIELLVMLLEKQAGILERIAAAVEPPQIRFTPTSEQAQKLKEEWQALSTGANAQPLRLSKWMLGDTSSYLATCPQCSHMGGVDTSEHVFFARNRLALRCRQCGHVWEDGSP